MSSERAGAHTSSALDREKAREVIAAYRGAPARMDDEYLDALEACVVPDPRIGRIEALLDDETLGDHLYPEDVRAILRGDQ